MYKTIEEQARQAMQELLEEAKLPKGSLIVVGCSSSEILGERIGKGSSPEAGAAVARVLLEETRAAGMYLAAQCCEHLNRALVVEKETAKAYRLEQVNAIPQPNHAGGAFGTVAYERMTKPVVVESLDAQASAGMDIGGTLIGMHIKPVVVPLRISVDQIGEATLICARRRPKYVGGERAIYDDALL